MKSGLRLSPSVSLIVLAVVTFCAQATAQTNRVAWVHLSDSGYGAMQAVVDRAGALGYDRITIDWSGNVAMDVAGDSKYTKAQAQALIDRAKYTAGLDVVPAVQLLGKTKAGFGDAFVAAHPEFVDSSTQILDPFYVTGDGRTVMDRYILAQIDEYVAMYHDPDYFFLGWDERPTDGIQAMADRHGMTAGELWAATMNRVCDHLLSNNITPAFWGEQFLSPLLAQSDNPLGYPRDKRFYGFLPLYSRYPPSTAQADLLPWADAIRNRDKLAVLPWHYNCGTYEGAYPSVDFLQWLGFGEVYGCSWYGDQEIQSFARYTAERNAAGTVASLWHVPWSPTVIPTLDPLLENSLAYCKRPATDVPSDIQPKILISKNDTPTAVVQPGDTVQLRLDLLRTDAERVFGGKVDCRGLISYSATDLTLTFTGLDPAAHYEVVVFGNRDVPSYADRITKVAIEGESTFVNASTPGASFSGPADRSTGLVNGYNTERGHVARFVQVDPGADGTFRLRVYDNESAARPKFYANAVMLRGVGFTAYNDLAWASGQRSHNITTFTRGQSGQLTDYATGVGAGVTLAVNTGGGGPYPAQGADAAAPGAFNLRERDGDTPGIFYDGWERLPFHGDASWLRAQDGARHVTWTPTQEGFYDIVGRARDGHGLLHQGHTECALLVTSDPIPSPPASACLLGADFRNDIVPCAGKELVVLRGTGGARFGFPVGNAHGVSEGLECRDQGGLKICRSAYDSHRLIGERTMMVEFKLLADQVTGTRSILSWGKYGSGWRLILTANNQVRIQMNYGCHPAVDIFGTTKLQTGRWYRVVAAADRANAYLWLDGHEEGSESADGTFAEPYYLHIGLGRDFDSSDDGLGELPHVNAVFREFGIWDVFWPDPQLAATQAPPCTPSDLAATAVSSSRIDVSWTDNANDESGFRIDRRMSGVGTWQTSFASLNADTESYNDTGLPANTKFYYVVRAYNAVGESGSTPVVDATTPLPAPPVAPSGLTAVAVSSSRIALSWTDKSSDESGFRIDRRQSGVSQWTTNFDSVGADTEAYSDPGLPAGTKFYYKVKAYNLAGNSAATPVSAATTLDGVTGSALWRYHKGTAEPAAPATAWRSGAFDDSGWLSGPGPFGYGDGPYGTDLAGDMRGNYTTLYVRRTLDVGDPAAVSGLELAALYDDGFILWLNGHELARVNAPGAPGTQPACTATATAAVGDGTAWSATYAGSTLPLLRAGNNVVAVMVLNTQIDSSDLTFELAITVHSDLLPAAETDLDGDRMADAWENDELGGTAAAPDADPDGDGFRNIDEYIIGGDPGTADQALAVQTTLLNGALIIRLPTRAADGPGYTGMMRCYALEQAGAEDPSTPWSVAPGCERIVGAGQTIVHTVPDTAVPLRFRARAWLED